MRQPLLYDDPFHRTCEGRKNESKVHQDRVAYLFSLHRISRRVGTKGFECHVFRPIPPSPRVGELLSCPPMAPYLSSPIDIN